MLKPRTRCDSLSRSLLAGVLLLAGCADLAAGDAKDDGWKFNFTPYAWGTSLKGQVASLPGVPPADIDVSLSDILSNLDIGLMGVGGARKGRFAVFGDLFYANISADADTRGLLFSGADYEQKLLFASAGVSWRVLDEDDYQLSALAGLRYYRLDNELKLTGAALPTTKINHVEDWVDPMIGLTGRVRLAPNWYASARVTTAIAGDSDTAYGLFGGIGYVFNQSLSAVAGYRYMKVDYEKGDFLFDVEMAGPTVGLAFHW